MSSPPPFLPVPAQHGGWFQATPTTPLRALARAPGSGLLWLATAGGVLCLDPEGGQAPRRYGSEHGLPGQNMDLVAVDGRDRVWVASHEAGLWTLEGEGWLPVATPDGGQQVQAMAVDNAGDLWVAWASLLARHRTPFELASPLRPLPDLAVRALASVAGELWLLDGRGLHGWRAGAWVPLRWQTGLSAITVLQGQPWVGGREGLFTQDSGRGWRAGPELPTSGEPLLAATADGLWVALGGKLERLDASDWRPTMTTKTPIVAMTPAKDVGLWVATDCTLRRVDAAGTRAILSFASVIPAATRALAADGGRLWAGGPAGLASLDTTTGAWRSETAAMTDVRALLPPAGQQAGWAPSGRGLFPLPPGSAPPTDLWALALLRTAAGETWAAGPAGLFQLRARGWTLCLSAGDLPAGTAITALADDGDDLWLGTTAGLHGYTKATQGLHTWPTWTASVRCLLALPDGLLIGADDGLHLLTPVNPGPRQLWDGAPVSALACGHDPDTLWLGTGQGLQRWTRGVGGFQPQDRWTPKDSGLAGAPVAAILPASDGQGRAFLWLATPGGVSAFCPGAASEAEDWGPTPPPANLLDWRDVSYRASHPNAVCTTPDPATAANGNPTPAPEEQPMERQWTVMVFMAGDNGVKFKTEGGLIKIFDPMEGAGWSDLEEMASAGSSPQVAVVAQFDTRADQEHSYRIILPAQGQAREQIPIPEQNTGDPASLRDFIVWGMQSFPARRYAVVLWNHGTGWKEDDIYAFARERQVEMAPKEATRSAHHRRSTRALFLSSAMEVATMKEEDLRGICYDDASMDFLDNRELAAAFSEACELTGNRIHLIGMDACLMSMVEVAWQIRDQAEVLVASQEVEPMAGWPYKSILNGLLQQPDMDAADLGRHIVAEYGRAFTGVSGAAPRGVTQAAIHLGQLQPLVDGLSALAGTIERRARDDMRLYYALLETRWNTTRFQDKDYMDLQDFIERLSSTYEGEDSEVRQALDDARALITASGLLAPVIARVSTGQALERACGLSIYLPDRGYSPFYDQLAFATCGWGRMIRKLNKIT